MINFLSSVKKKCKFKLFNNSFGLLVNSDKKICKTCQFGFYHNGEEKEGDHISIFVMMPDLFHT